MKKLVAPVAAAAVLGVLALVLKRHEPGIAQGGFAAIGNHALTALYAGLWLTGAWTAKRLIEFLLVGAKTEGGEPRVPKLAFDLLGVLLFGAAVIAVIGFVFRMPVGGLLATSGLLTGVIAFAVRDLIADIFAGIALAVEQPLRIGDWVQFDGGTPPESGRVVEMNWRAVRMVTVQGRTIVYPNNALARRNFVNLSKPERYFRTVKQVCVDFSAPPDQIIAIILSAIKATPGIVESQPPLILIDELNARGTVFSIHFWVPDYPAMFLIERQVMVNVITFLNQAGYSPAYQKHEIDPSWRHRREVATGPDIPDLLRRVPLFATLTNDERGQLAEKASMVRFPAGSTIVSEQEAGDSLFVVLSGLAKVTKSSPGKQTEIGSVRPGEVFGEMSLLTGNPRMASITAATDTTLVEIKRDHLLPLLQANAGMVDRLGEIQATRLNALDLMENASSDERQEIREIGVAAYLKRQISRFFNIGP